jgi:hemoglobin
MSKVRFNAVAAMFALLLAAIVVIQTQVAGKEPDASSGPSLYKRLGGYDAIAAVTDDFIGRLATDKKLSKFFVGLSDNSKARVRQHVVDLICATTGGPCVYLGQDMKTAHRGLNITEAEWQASVDDFTATLDKFGVKQKERDELFAILGKVKPDIVTAK